MEKLGDGIKKRLESAHDHDVFDVNIFMNSEPAAQQLNTMFADAEPVEKEDLDPQKTIAQIKGESAEIQQDLLNFLNSVKDTGANMIDSAVAVPPANSIESFWITNALGAEIDRKTLNEVLDRDDVAHVEISRYADIKDLIDGKLDENQKEAVDSTTPTWSVKRINAPLLWQNGLNGEGALVAVIDTGVNYKHPDLVNQMWNGAPQYLKHGYDFAGNDNDPMDEQGHGTSCAGIVAGNGASGSQTGVAPQATIIALRVGGSERNYWNAFQFAIDQRVDVISMSMTWKFPNSPNYPGWRRACESLLAANIAHANSIGNQGHQQQRFPIPYNISTPGNCPPPRSHAAQTPVGGLSSAIACGATDDTDSLAYYSGRGPAAWEKAPFVDYPYNNGAQKGLIKPDVCAPGPGTTSCNYLFPAQSTKPYSRFGGTSSATPHVGGCLALLVSACKKSQKPIIPARLLEALESTTVRISGQTQPKENDFGAGRVDVYAAWKYGVQKGWW